MVLIHFDLAGMQLISKYNKGIKEVNFYLDFINIYSKYAWAVL